MSATVDANLLLYASDTSSPHHERASASLRRLTAGPELLYVLWPVAIAYLRIATHASIFDRPLSPDVARGNLTALLRQPHVRSPGEKDGFWDVFERVCSESVARGNVVTEVHIAALMRQHEVRTIWTSDRDFRRFDDITVRDPLG